KPFAIFVFRLAIALQIPAAVRVQDELRVVPVADRFESHVTPKCGEVFGASTEVSTTIFAGLESRRPSTEARQTFLHEVGGHSTCTVVDEKAPRTVLAVLNLNRDLPELRAIHRRIGVVRIRD